MTQRDANALRARLRGLPSVDRVAGALTDTSEHDAVAYARRAVDAARGQVREGADTPTFEEIADEARRLMRLDERRRLQPVINATGVLIHTNLGRVPLGEAQLDAVALVAGGYSNLEYDLEDGRRGSRYEHAQQSLARLTGAEAALAVNNNAGAVLVVLSALCREREVIISRGELIEIGGEFRIPDVMSLSGARLVEVGTTNRTHLVDYERAIAAGTAAILKVHPSNYRVVGFTSSVAGRDLARLARGKGVMFLHDLGSGLVGAPSSAPGMTDEPPVDVSLAEGADVVTFSGDKLFGGPQAGIVAGRSHLVQRVARDPLIRALRVDKMTLAALEATARLYLEGRATELPLWAALTAPLEELEQRAHRLAAALDETLGATGLKVEAIASRAVTGGGSLPGAQLSSWGVALAHQTRSAADLGRTLRGASPPVVGRIEDDRLVLDLRPVAPRQDEELREAVTGALS